MLLWGFFCCCFKIVFFFFFCSSSFKLIHSWLCWLLIALHGRSPAEGSRGYTWVWVSPSGGFSWDAQAVGRGPQERPLAGSRAWAQERWLTGWAAPWRVQYSQTGCWNCAPDLRGGFLSSEIPGKPLTYFMICTYILSNLSKTGNVDRICQIFFNFLPGTLQCFPRKWSHAPSVFISLSRAFCIWQSFLEVLLEVLLPSHFAVSLPINFGVLLILIVLSASSFLSILVHFLLKERR